MSEVTAEQLREALRIRDEVHENGARDENWPFPYAEAGQTIEDAARLLADHPLTLAALQNGWEEKEPMIDEGGSDLVVLPHGAVVLIPKKDEHPFRPVVDGDGECVCGSAIGHPKHQVGRTV